MNCIIIENTRSYKKNEHKIIKENDKKKKIILKYKKKSKIIYPSRYDYINGKKVYNYDKDCSPIYKIYTILNNDEKEIIEICFETAIKYYNKEQYNNLLKIVNKIKTKEA